ncbi:unnamed protein product [Orchesella dallaii]|uniref:Protein kinase domain-containing protein n=1 Tax=Orchesella dallaii TaxID=48710 RepID=A0ABP1PUU5_9HEXA
MHQYLFKCSFFVAGSSIYFTQSEVNLTRTFIPESGLLYAVNALRERSEDGLIHYYISKQGGGGGEGKSKAAKCPDLVIDKNLGNIHVSLPENSKKDYNEAINFGKIGSACNYTIVARLVGNSTEKAEMTLILNVNNSLITLTKDDCRGLSKKELCFGGIDNLELRVMENAPLTTVAYLGPIPEICGMLQVSYNVSAAQGVLSAAKAGSGEPLPDILITKAGLDREEKELYQFSVSCILTSSETPNNHEVIGIGAKLKILDENDNALVSNSDGTSHVTVFLSLSDINYHLVPGKRLIPAEHSVLLAKDSDTASVNNFKIFNLNDTEQLLELNFTQHQISDHVGAIAYTAFITTIKLSEHVKGTISPWEGDYCVASVITDSTVVIPEKRDQNMKYTICVRWGPIPPPPRPERPLEDLLNRLSNRVDQASISRNAQRYAPVLYSFPDIVEDISETVSGLEFSIVSTIAYSMEEDFEGNSAGLETKMIASVEFNDIFDVTPHMGIIHLLHPEFIRNTSFQSFQLQLLCNSSLIPSFSTNVTITLESPVIDEILCDAKSFCSEKSDRKTCEDSCGYGSPGKCLWRQENEFNNSLNISNLGNDTNDEALDESVGISQYSTCSPHLGTCPDGKCDELEQLFPLLCPQDCATEMRGFAPLLKHSNGKSYGIDGKHCKGLGTCQESNICSCGHLPSTTMYEEIIQSNGTNLVFSTTVGTDCGPRCVMMYMAISLIVMFAVIISIYVWKARVDQKRKARSLNQSVMMTNGGIEIRGEYGDNMGNGTLISEAEYGPGGMNHAVLMVSDDQFAPNQIVLVDEKWEIHRDDLFLEHVLGEGQYGRVLKGRLRGHSGGGHTPVAVKMLKVDGSEGSKSLWQEFMAEFSLLKQVDHPNVIKLLGACTTTGGPPYIVMEYAEYGALRSFLRKCRRVEKINGSHCALHWDNADISLSPTSDPLDSDYFVTPREVLGFSWQIAKGMAYLSDMKMVHRDLAARNILLTKMKACKISDFGLTRDIYVDDAYQKKSKDRVPVKWLAPECLADELYTTKSDVWAFGVLVWELTTLGASPYPGIQTEHLYSLLNAGFRMEKPHNCSTELYSLMMRCWAYQPTDRPTFHQIVQELSRMLEDGIEYLQLDVPSVSNPGYDYFSQSEQTGSEMVNVSPPNVSPISEVRPMSRRKLSMENLRLIDYEISTDDEFLRKRNSDSHCTKHTYINDPQISEQDCSKIKSPISHSGYESPIRSTASVAV